MSLLDGRVPSGAKSVQDVDNVSSPAVLRRGPHRRVYAFRPERLLQVSGVDCSKSSMSSQKITVLLVIILSFYEHSIVFCNLFCYSLTIHWWLKK